MFTVELPMGADHLPADRVSQTARTLEQRRAAVELADLHNQVVMDTASEAISTTDTEEIEQIPTSTVAKIDIAALPNSPVSPESTTILVVDDNPDLRTYVATILKNRGYHIKTADNGATGLAAARHIQIRHAGNASWCTSSVCGFHRVSTTVMCKPRRRKCAYNCIIHSFE